MAKRHVSNSGPGPDAAGNANVFGTYLETIRGSSSSQSGRDRVAGIIAGAVQGEQYDAAQGVLNILDDSGPQSMPDLIKKVRVPLEPLINLLDGLQKVGLVTLPGQSGKDRIELTPAGMKLVKELTTS